METEEFGSLVDAITWSLFNVSHVPERRATRFGAAPSLSLSTPLSAYTTLTASISERRVHYRRRQPKLSIYSDLIGS